MTLPNLFAECAFQPLLFVVPVFELLPLDLFGLGIQRMVEIVLKYQQHSQSVESHKVSWGNTLSLRAQGLFLYLGIVKNRQAIIPKDREQKFRTRGQLDEFVPREAQLFELVMVDDSFLEDEDEVRQVDLMGGSINPVQEPSQFAFLGNGLKEHPAEGFAFGGAFFEQVVLQLQLFEVWLCLDWVIKIDSIGFEMRMLQFLQKKIESKDVLVQNVGLKTHTGVVAVRLPDVVLFLILKQRLL